MIKQIAPVPSGATPTPSLKKGLIKARHIQAHLKNLEAGDAKPKNGILWDPAKSAPYLVQVTRWIE